MNLTYLEVDRQQQHYNNMSPSMRHDFMERLLMSWVYHEHALEGIVLTPDDMQRALAGEPAQNYCEGRTYRSIRNITDCAQYLMQCAQKGEDFVSLQWLRELHEKVTVSSDARVGAYRKRNTAAGVYNLDVVPANSVSYHIRKLLDAYHDEYQRLHPIRAAALFHWEFMRIFPFDEQTGLLGRLVLNYMLMKDNYSPAIIHAMDRPQYFGALRGYREDLVDVVINALNTTAAAARNHITEQSQLTHHQLSMAG